DVRLLQKLLGFSEEEQDGIFGAITEEGVKRFQRRRGFDVTGDADERTWEALRREAQGLPGVSPPSVKPVPQGSQPDTPQVRPIGPAPAPQGSQPDTPQVRPIGPAPAPQGSQPDTPQIRPIGPARVPQSSQPDTPQARPIPNLTEFIPKLTNL